MKRSPSTSRISAESGKPSLRTRALFDNRAARDLAGLFKLLSNKTRLRLLHAVHQSDELCVTDVAAELDMTPQAISNQLQRLADRRIVEARREGIAFSIASPIRASKKQERAAK
jgi:ArsR family transcriptional regulator, lead/cadmium/zinc/bismuth-responsive transcriptional repressor